MHCAICLTVPKKDTILKKKKKKDFKYYFDETASQDNSSHYYGAGMVNNTFSRCNLAARSCDLTHSLRSHDLVDERLPRVV